MKYFLGLLMLIISVSSIYAHHGSGGGYSFSANGGQGIFTLQKRQLLLANDFNYSFLKPNTPTSYFTSMYTVKTVRNNQFGIGYGISNRLNGFANLNYNITNTEEQTYKSLQLAHIGLLYLWWDKSKIKSSIYFEYKGKPKQFVIDENAYWQVASGIGLQSFTAYQRWTLNLAYNYSKSSKANTDLGAQLNGQLAYELPLSTKDSLDGGFSITLLSNYSHIDKSRNGNSVILNTGLNQVDLGGVINWISPKNLGVSASCLLPVYQQIIGVQSNTQIYFSLKIFKSLNTTS